MACRTLGCWLFATVAAALRAVAQEECPLPTSQVGVSCVLALPQHGASLHRVGGAAFRIGHYFDTYLAVEGEVSQLESATGFAVRGLCHWAQWDEFGQLFGYERFDPFFTVGVNGWIGHEVGPNVGAGWLYYLNDEWALRFDWQLTLGLSPEPASAHALAFGVQRSF